MRIMERVKLLIKRFPKAERKGVLISDLGRVEITLSDDTVIFLKGARLSDDPDYFLRGLLELAYRAGHSDGEDSKASDICERLGL